MLGLLIKDIQLTLLSKKLLGIIGAIGIMMLFIKGESATSFVVSFFSIVCGMLVLTTISHDDFGHGLTYLMALPTDRRTYALEKYAFALLSLLFGWSTSSIVTFAYIMFSKTDLNVKEWWLSSGGILLAISLMLIIMLPIQLKFGGDNGRMVTMGFLATIIVLVSAGQTICKSRNIDIVSLMNTLWADTIKLNKAMLILIAATIYIALLGISLYASSQIVKKKQL